MKFFIDAQLPRQITVAFTTLGHEAIHARDLPKGNDTKDEEILKILEVDIVIVSKDADFYHSALIRSRPAKLIYVKIPNQPRKVVIDLFNRTAPRLIELLEQHDILQLEMDSIISII